MYESNIGLPDVINPFFLIKELWKITLGKKKNYNVSRCSYHYKMSGSLAITIKLDRTSGGSDIWRG